MLFKMDVNIRVPLHERRQRRRQKLHDRRDIREYPHLPPQPGSVLPQFHIELHRLM